MVAMKGEYMKSRSRRKSTIIFLLVAVALFLFAHSTGYAQTQNKFRLKPDAAGKGCLNCHDNFKSVLKKQFLHTPVKTDQCTGCHDPHTASHGKLLAEEPNRICSKCHAAVTPKNARSVHRVVLEGKCVTCHDPHASDTKFNLTSPGNALCLSCHKEMGTRLAKAKFKHSPVEKGCMNCHDPHASAKSDHLLKADLIPLCVNCHKTNNPNFSKAHMNYPVATAQCTSCHDPHGSSTSGMFFDNVHAPVAKKMCTQCHDAPTSSTPFKTKKTGFELCRGCHNTMMNETFGKNRMHWPVMDKKGCQNCHEPHASTHKKLLNGDGRSVCGKCHTDTMAVQVRLAEKERQEKAAAAKGQVIKGALTHDPIQEGNCEACHSPHSSDRTLLLKGPNTIELCGTCHDWLKHTSHPMGDKTLDIRNKNLKMDCLSCHRSHGTGYRYMIPWPAATDLCVQCHKQYRR
jgi:predicted CXXCH cytochrome family protein